jgi:hypothetical protein
MEPEEKKPRLGQFTLKGLLGFTMLVAVSLAAIRTGVVTDWEWPGLGVLVVLAGLSLLGAASAHPHSRADSRGRGGEAWVESA